MLFFFISECGENEVVDERDNCETQTCYDYRLELSNMPPIPCNVTGMAMVDCYCDEGFYLSDDKECVTPEKCLMCELENGMMIPVNIEFNNPTHSYAITVLCNMDLF